MPAMYYGVSSPIDSDGSYEKGCSQNAGTSMCCIWHTADKQIAYHHDILVVASGGIDDMVVSFATIISKASCIYYSLLA